MYLFFGEGVGERIVCNSKGIYTTNLQGNYWFGYMERKFNSVFVRT